MFLKMKTINPNLRNSQLLSKYFVDYINTNTFRHTPLTDMLCNITYLLNLIKSSDVCRGYFSTGSVTFLIVPRTFLFRAAAFNRSAKNSTFGFRANVILKI